MVPPKKDDIVVTNPDPTVAVKEALELAIRNLDEKIALQIASINAATALARGELADRLAALERSITGSANEKFAANEKLVDQLAKANQVALTAALQTQKESAAKSELSMADLLKQLQVSFETANKATNEKIDRLTSRLDTGEGRSGGVDTNRRDNRQESVDSHKLTLGILSIAVAVAAAIAGYVLGQK